MRVLLTTYGSRGDIEPLVGLAVALKTLGAEAIVCGPGDQEFVELLDRAGIEFAPAVMPVRQWIAEKTKLAQTNFPQVVTELMSGMYEAISVAAKGCDAIVATG